MGKKGQFPCALHDGICRWGYGASVEGGRPIHPAAARTLHPSALLRWGHVSPKGFLGQVKLHSRRCHEAVTACNL